MGDPAELKPEYPRDRRSTGGSGRPNMQGHGLLDLSIAVGGAQHLQSRAPTLTTDNQTMGGRLMRSGPRPLRASPRIGKTTDAKLWKPTLGTGSPGIATTENNPQQVAITPLPSSPAGCGTTPSSWC